MIPILQQEATFAALGHLCGIRVLFDKARGGLLAHKQDVRFHIALGTVTFISEKSWVEHAQVSVCQFLVHEAQGVQSDKTLQVFLKHSFPFLQLVVAHLEAD